MDIKKLEEDIFSIALPIAEQFACELVDVEYEFEEGEWYLRIYVDKENGINIDDCASVSRVLSDKLDIIDPIKDSYYLEVSSPGLDRKIKRDKDFIKFLNNKIKIKFIKPFEGNEYLEGILMGLEGDKVLVSSHGNLYKIDKSSTSFIKLNDF
jgi:ribosome maturation factor RimP